MVIRERFYTAEDLWKLSHLPENDDKRFELVEGELREMSPAGGKHGEIALDFGAVIRNFVKANNLGYCTAAETGYILFKNPDGKDTVRAPDVGFVAAARLPDGMPDGYPELAPDLAVEVVSPNDRADEIEEKVKDYLRYGTRMVIVVYPGSESILVHTPTTIRRLNLDDILDGGDVLPGFSVKVREIFGK